MFSLIFDLDDTLYFQADQFYEAVRKTNFLPNQSAKERLYKAFVVASEGTYLLHDRGEITLKEMRQQRIQQAYASLGVKLTKTQADQWQELYEIAQGKIELSPIMVDLFTACQLQNIQLGLITNGPSTHQRRKIAALGLERWIPKEHILVSGDLGISKPDARIFQKMASQLSQKTQTFYYIGDNPQNDILGALKVGWQTIWLNQTGAELPPHAKMKIVRSQTELVVFLKGLLSEEK